jgi:hypothetical protein
MKKTNMAVWNGFRIQSNGIVFIEDTLKPASEQIIGGERYLRIKNDPKVPNRRIKVAKAVFMLFGPEKIEKMDRTWNVEYRDENMMNCNIANLKYREHKSNTISREKKQAIRERYQKGVVGSGYYALAKEFGTSPSHIKYIVTHG